MKSLVKKVQGYFFAIDYVYVFKTRTAKHNKTSQVSVVFHDEFVQVVQCCSIKCKKRNHKYCISRAKLFTSGDVELNPGPVVTQGNNRNNVIELLQSRLAQHGLRMLDVGGAGDCFFRVVSHQLYGEPSYHMNIRSIGVQYLRNNPESRFIESNTDHSWSRYLAYMSHQGAWADVIVIQAVADALNLAVHIIESNPGFASVTNISPVNSETDTTVINIGHLDEIHYVSTVPFNEEAMANNVICNNQPAQLTMEHYGTTNNNETIAVTKERKRKAYLMEYMATRRSNKEYRNKQNRAVQAKRLENIEKTRESQRRAFKRRKDSNSDHIRELNRQAFVKRKKSNLQHIREMNKNAQNRKRSLTSGLNPSGHDLLQPATKRRSCTAVNEIHEFECKDSLQEVQAMAKVIQTFHDKIKCGPEYVCTCCDQLWYRSSVRKCAANKYPKCCKKLLEACITSTTIIDNTKWICSTCHSNLSDGKLPVCSKANKMGFPVKPQCLNLTPLEERLISPRIPFMQIRELPRGGQLSIHGNVVNVPADVNSTVSTLPRSINESQTIPVKLNRRLSYKHHYQFQDVRPRKVLEAAKYLVKTSQLFQNEHIEVQENWLDNPDTRANDALENQSNEWKEFLSNSCSSTANAEVLSTDPEITISEATQRHDNYTEQVVTDCNGDDGWCEVEERTSGVTDTLLQEPARAFIYMIQLKMLKRF